MRRSLVTVFFVALVVAFARWQSAAVDAPSTQSTTAAVTVPIQAMSGSSQVGTATLTSTADNKTQVVIQLTGAPASSQEPAHIHPGTCNKLDPKPAYPLTTVAAGKSTSIVDTPLKSLQTGGFAINVHESTSNLGKYVACGNIAPSPAAAPPAPEPMST